MIAPSERNEEKVLVVIPSRLASQRLPNKPLALIGNAPMVVHVMRRAQEADVGPVLVACGDEEIAICIEKAGGTALITDPELPSGSDRVWAATQQFDPEGVYDRIINVQGDLPTLDPALIRVAAVSLNDPEVQIATLAAKFSKPEEWDNPNVVKVVAGFSRDKKVARALYFSRQTVPGGDGDLYHHVGLYAFRRSALELFVSLPEGILERRERLEQLRALENGMNVISALVDTVPLSVDTQADLERARKLLA